MASYKKTYPREHQAYRDMKKRCLNKNHPKFSRYGGRGIKICSRWLGDGGFDKFFLDLGTKPRDDFSLERVDNNKGYSPDNCIWASRRAQATNKSNSRLLTIKGITKTLVEWSEVSGIKYTTIHMRIVRGKWGAEKAVFTPVK